MIEKLRMTRPIAASPAVYRDLENRSVFVSGGATGIGAAIVTLFARQGSAVTFVDIDEEAGVALVERVADDCGNRPAFVACDVTHCEALKVAVESAARPDGTLSVLVNNAARDLRVPAGDVTPEIWDDLVAVNLKHQFFAAQAARPLMAKAGGGSIINFGSIAPWIAVPDLAVYSSCKAAAFGLTRSLARDFGVDGIRVNSLLPGAILTERQRRDWISEEDRIAIHGRQCLKRDMVEEDVAEMVLFLASDASRGCTGQEFRVDGGNL